MVLKDLCRALICYPHFLVIALVIQLGSPTGQGAGEYLNQ
jgi:hypothetical protein